MWIEIKRVSNGFVIEAEHIGLPYRNYEGVVTDEKHYDDTKKEVLKKVEILLNDEIPDE